MQPYLLPYIRYWQLINAVDKIIILAAVQNVIKMVNLQLFQLF